MRVLYVCVVEESIDAGSERNEEKKKMIKMRVSISVKVFYLVFAIGGIVYIEILEKVIFLNVFWLG